MADTRIQGLVEDWVRTKALSKLFNKNFEKKKLLLNWGGTFEFDAVADDMSIAVCISTSKAKTSSGRPAVGQRFKIKSDTLFLMSIAKETEKILCFTDMEMMKSFESDRSFGRFPPDQIIKLLHIEIPEELNKKLSIAREIASKEVSPKKK